jgi:phage terminase large subunit-like protein
VPFPQGQARLESDKGLYYLITTRRLAHDGQQAALTEHLANANRKLDADGRMRIIKRAYRLKIDLAVALGMAAQRAGETLIAAPAAVHRAPTANRWKEY